MIDDDLTRKLGEAGVDIGAMGIQWGKRPDKLPTCAIQDRDLRLLRFLHDFNYASTSTLAAMFWGRYGSAVRERLKLLHDVGLVRQAPSASGEDPGSARVGLPADAARLADAPRPRRASRPRGVQARKADLDRVRRARRAGRSAQGNRVLVRYQMGRGGQRAKLKSKGAARDVILIPRLAAILEEHRRTTR